MLTTIICLVKWAVHAVGQTILAVVDVICTALIIAVNAIVSLLPNDPTQGGGLSSSGILGMFNYVVPLGSIMSEFTLVMTAWILHRIYQWLLRWAKAEG